MSEFSQQTEAILSQPELEQMFRAAELLLVPLLSDPIAALRHEAEIIQFPSVIRPEAPKEESIEPYLGGCVNGVEIERIDEESQTVWSFSLPEPFRGTLQEHYRLVGAERFTAQHWQLPTGLSIEEIVARMQHGPEPVPADLDRSAANKLSGALGIDLLVQR